MTATAHPAVPTGHDIKFDTAYGRIIVKGQAYRRALGVPGAHHNWNRDWVEVSLTLDSMRTLRRIFGMEKKQFAAKCSPQLLSWAQAAGRYERQLMDLHERLEKGWTLDLPWRDATGQDRAPLQHQKVMATVACSLDGAAFLCEMGTMKTRSAVEAIRYHFDHGTLDHVIVVCPKSVMGTWVREVAMWGSTDMRTVRLDGQIVKRIAKIKSNFGQLKTVWIVNYDTLGRMKDTWEWLMEEMKVGMVLDEMHRIRNPSTQVTQAAMELARKAQWRLGQTGTLVLNGLQDVWAPWYFVDLGTEFGANFVQFRREWLDENPYNHTIAAKDGALTAVGAKLRRRGLRYTKAECLDLPDKVYEPLEVEMTPAQRQAYNEMSEYLIAHLREMEQEGTATAANQLVSILRLSQITSGFVPIEESGEFVRFSPNVKLDALEETVRDQIGEHSIIVWAKYREDVRAITERLTDLQPVVIQGGQSTRVRDEAEEFFKSGRAKLLVANPASGGEGLDLWRASLAIYFSQGYSLLHRAQSEDRCHRKGSEMHNKVTYIDLTCRGTIDEIILNALDKKQSVADAVVDLKAHIVRGV